MDRARRIARFPCPGTTPQLVAAILGWIVFPVLAALIRGSVAQSNLDVSV